MEMPRRQPKRDPVFFKYDLLRQGIPQSEWPVEIAEKEARLEALYAGWSKQLKALRAKELRVVANAALMLVEALETQNRDLRAELEKRDRLRSKRGDAARLPAVQRFKDIVRREWEKARKQGGGRVARGFATEMVGRKDATVTDPRTVLRWCREWAAEVEAARNPPLRLPGGGVYLDVFARVGLLREMVVGGRRDDPTS